VTATKSLRSQCCTDISALHDRPSPAWLRPLLPTNTRELPCQGRAAMKMFVLCAIAHTLTHIFICDCSHIYTNCISHFMITGYGTLTCVRHVFKSVHASGMQILHACANQALPDLCLVLRTRQYPGACYSSSMQCRLSNRLMAIAGRTSHRYHAHTFPRRVRNRRRVRRQLLVCCFDHSDDSFGLVLLIWRCHKRADIALFDRSDFGRCFFKNTGL
jgi:hypothetical protein